MLIGDKYKLESESMNIVLAVKQVMTGAKIPSAKGKINWLNLAYFNDPKEALNYIVQHEIRSTGFTDLETIVAKVDELYQLIQAIPDEALPQLVK